MAKQGQRIAHTNIFTLESLDSSGLRPDLFSKEMLAMYEQAILDYLSTIEIRGRHRFRNDTYGQFWVSQLVHTQPGESGLLFHVQQHYEFIKKKHNKLGIEILNLSLFLRNNGGRIDVYDLGYDGIDGDIIELRTNCATFGLDGDTLLLDVSTARSKDYLTARCGRFHIKFLDIKVLQKGAGEFDKPVCDPKGWDF